MQIDVFATVEEANETACRSVNSRSRAQGNNLVGTSLVKEDYANLARPGGNVTGLSSSGSEHEMVRRMEPISPVYPSRATRNRWCHYERWRTPLGRFVAIADAARSYNPRFGQGMSAAAVSARLLKDCLDTYGIDDPRLPGRFFSAQAQFQRTPWLFAAADDLRLPATEGKRSVSVRVFNWYRPKLVACPDRRVGACLAEVTHLVKPRSALFAPRVVSHVLASAMRRGIKAMGRKASSDGLRPMPPDGE